MSGTELARTDPIVAVFVKGWRVGEGQSINESISQPADQLVSQKLDGLINRVIYTFLYNACTKSCSEKYCTNFTQTN